jgi:hypothetical protein
MAANDDLDITPIQKLPDMNHRSKFVPGIYTYSKVSPPQRDLLIAVMEGRIVRLVRIGLNP